MNVLKIIMCSLVIIASLIFCITSIIVSILNKKLVHLESFSEIDKAYMDAVTQHQNYVNFSIKKGLSPDNLDKDLMMAIYTLGLMDGLDKAQRSNKKIVEKILSENFC